MADLYQTSASKVYTTLQGTQSSLFRQLYVAATAFSMNDVMNHSWNQVNVNVHEWIGAVFNC